MTRQEEILKGLNESWGQSGINVSSNTANSSNGITVNNPTGSGRAVELNFVDGINATRLTSAQIAALPNPQAGQIVYQTDGVVGLYTYDGTSWVTVKGSTTVFGTTNRISVTGGDTIDIASTYVGQTSITTLGTVTTGTWSAVIGQATMTLGSDAAGDIYYRDGSGKLTRLGIGSAGQVLGVSAGIPAWQAAGGGITVGTTTITSGTSGRIAFNNAGVYGESANLFWDNSNNTLTINNTGTFTPLALTTNCDVGYNWLTMTSTGTYKPVHSLQQTTSTGGLLFRCGAGQSNLGTVLEGSFGTPTNSFASNSSSIGVMIRGWDGGGPMNNSSTVLLVRNYTTNLMSILGSGRVGIGVSSPTGMLHLPAGTAAANTAPIKLTAGTNLTTPENGAFEFDGTNLFFTPSSTRNILAQISGSTGLTTSQIPFATTNGYLTSTSNFNWDNTNNRLNIGTSSPAYSLGSMWIQGNNTSGSFSRNSVVINTANQTSESEIMLTTNSVNSTVTCLRQYGTSSDFPNTIYGINPQGYAHLFADNAKGVLIGTNTSSTFIGMGTGLQNTASNLFFWGGSSGVSIKNGTTTATAYLHLGAGTAAAGSAPIKLTAGTNLTTPEDGAFEFDGTNLYFTVGGVRKTVTLI